ncbi:hypothetical protein ACFSC4_31570 [Deinococcus malanensis]|uniref:hypothetical protein n=1 Tax=Deinococcus malanensis TaxID=1706855 RepID=UPI00362960AD
MIANAVRSPEDQAALDRPGQESTAARPQAASTTSAVPETPAEEAGASEPVEPTPEPPAPVPESTRYTDVQNLAIAAGRDPNDPEIAEKYARLDALCPDESPSTADLVVNLQQLVKEESGRELEIMTVLDEFITGQEGVAEVGMTCVETGNALASLLGKGP